MFISRIKKEFRKENIKRGKKKKKTKHFCCGMTLLEVLKG